MKLATIKNEGEEFAVIITAEKAVSIREINRVLGMGWSEDLFSILEKNQLSSLNDWYRNGGMEKLGSSSLMDIDNLSFGPLYRNPGKIWGVGMNYVEKAIELSGSPPGEEPVIFMKPITSVIGPNDPIILPDQDQSSQVTAEAELGVIIGKMCKNIKEEEARNVVAGFTTTLDMTAKDIHAKDPRFLQRSKSFDTFFSFGPYFLTIDECQDLENIRVSTSINGCKKHQNVVRNMMFKPWWIVSFFSEIMTLHPGDIIMTGTPGSVLIRDRDVVGCEISGFKELRNLVVGKYSVN
ncbi:fumarylacetoacetate hydrolase family protein [Metabacillus endolithicus]|uniref:Fumarylacetoacetate hydrolase family protein n=1 Tax=Metabacillus endolithicus TaxID=1535204 RepID=A0ABW5BVC1_9BACI|nr:fumarylacetoacetate hydrolase family protein [Metabacillus endolithicus]UPG62781.1 fumarylacetoacetate hydrolase family protein [Metabacillus endolithicus]